MRQVLFVALLGLCAAAAQPVEPGWPRSTCVHGTTLNLSTRPLQIRALEGTVRTLLNEAGVSPFTPDCQTFINVLFQAGPMSARGTRITAHLVIADREVNLTDVAGSPSGEYCRRTLISVVPPQNDLQQSAQRLIRRLLSSPPQCSTELRS